MVSAGWWPGTPPQQRQNLVAGRMLALPDGSWWLFGAWGRWYRWTRADGQWHLCPPPQLSITRMSARPLQQGMPVPPVPPHVVPTGPDLAYDPPSPLAFVDAGVRPEVTSRVRATVESAAALPTPDYPHWWGLFSPSVPSAVPVTWGVMLWCATAPVFDSRIDAQLLGLWSSHRARPLPEIDGPRWLTPPPLESLIGLYTERLRAGRVDSAVVILRTMWAIASALREDVRFQPRADALIAMLGVTLQNPTVDYGALSYGDRAVVQQWLTRCPPALAPSLRVEASAGEHFRNAYYDLATAVAPIAGEPSERGYVEPRLIAAALLAADLSVVRQDVSGQVIGWLDPQVGEMMRAMLIQSDHPLRPFWPEGDRMPRSLRERMDTAGPAVRNTLLATMYGADLAWCRLGGGIPARPRGFPSSVAILAEIVGPRRATSAASTEPAASQAPGIAPLAYQYPSNPSTPGRTPGVPMAQEPPTGPPGQAPAWASPSGSPPPPATEAWEGSTPWPTTGEREPGTPAAPPATEAWSGPGPGGGGPGSPPPATEAWLGPDSGPAGGHASPPPTEAWSGAEGLDEGGPKAPPATQAWLGTGESAPGASASPPATQAWHGTGESASSAPTPPPATQAWHGTGESVSGTPTPPPATQAWPGTGEHEAGGSVSPPAATQAWLGTGESAPGAPTPPPATQAWPGTGEHEPGGTVSPPPATQAWPGTGEREVGGAASSPAAEARSGSEGLDTDRPKPAPATQAWPGTGEHEAGGSVSPPAATQAWPGTGSGDASSPPPGGGASSGSGVGPTGGVSSAGAARSGSETGSPGGAGSEASAEARLGAEGLDAGGPEPSPSAQATSGGGEVGGAGASGSPAAQASYEPEGRNPGGAGSLPSDSVAWLGAEGLDSDGPKSPSQARSWPGTGGREAGAPASDEARPGSSESGIGGTGRESGAGGEGSTGSTGSAGGAGSPSSGAEASSAAEDSDDEGSATRAWTEAERLEALSESPSGTEAWPATGEQETGDSAVPPETGARPGAEDSDAGESTPPTAQAWSSAEGIERDEAASASRPSTESAPPSAASTGTESPEAGSSRPGENDEETPLPPPTAPAGNGAPGASSDSGDTPLAAGDEAATANAATSEAAIGEAADDRTAADMSAAAVHNVPSAGAFDDRTAADAGGSSGGQDAASEHAAAVHNVASDHAAGAYDGRTIADAGGAWSDRTMADVSGLPGVAGDDRALAGASGSPGARPAGDEANDDTTGIDADDDDRTAPDDDRTAFDEHLNNATMLDPLDSSADQAKNATYVDWIGGTLADAGPMPLVAPAPVTPGPPRTRMIEEQVPDEQEPEPPKHPGTRIMSGTMVSGLLGTRRCPSGRSSRSRRRRRPRRCRRSPSASAIRFLSGVDDATELFDETAPEGDRLAAPSGRPRCCSSARPHTRAAAAHPPHRPYARRRGRGRRLGPYGRRLASCAATTPRRSTDGAARRRVRRCCSSGSTGPSWTPPTPAASSRPYARAARARTAPC